MASRTTRQMTTQEYVEKAVMAANDLASAGGLNPMQTEKFLDFVVDNTVLKPHTRIVRVTGASAEINKIGIGRRVAMAATEAQDPRMRRGVTTSKITLTPKEIIVPFAITDNFKEENIEQDRIAEHVLKMMATQLANDLEEFSLWADSNGAAVLESDFLDGGSTTQYRIDSYLALTNGWMRRVDTNGHLENLSGAVMGATVFDQMLREKWRRNRAVLRWFLSPDLAQIWRLRMSGRATQVGDRALEGAENLKPFGIEMVEVPLMPSAPKIVEHITLTGVTVSSLRYPNISNVVVTPSTLGTAAQTPYINVTDYVLDTTAGTIVRNGGGAIPTPSTVKVTYNTYPQILLTARQNLIAGIGREIRLEKGRNHWERVDEYVMTVKLDTNVEETDACVKGYNVSPLAS